MKCLQQWLKKQAKTRESKNVSNLIFEAAAELGRTWMMAAIIVFLMVWPAWKP